MGFCRRRVTPVLRVLRLLHRRVWRLPQTGAGGRFHQTHRAYISRATLDSERHWTPLDLEAGSIVWALKRLRGYLWGTKFRIFSDHKALESIGKVGNHNARVQRWLEFLTAFDYTLEYRKGSANGNADFLSRLPEPATEHDRNGSTSLNPVEDGGIYLVRVCGLNTPSSPIPGVGLGGLVPRTDSIVLGGLPFTSADYCDFRTHGPRLRIDDPSAPSGRFVARVSTPVSAIDRCPGRGRSLPAADNAFASVFAVPTRVGEGSAEAPAAATPVAQPTPSRSPIQGSDSVEPNGQPASAPAPQGAQVTPLPKPASDRISTRTRRRAATAAGVEPPAVDYGFGPGGAPRPFARRANTPPRVPPAAAGSAHRRDPCSCRLVGPDGANTVRPRRRRACGHSSLTTYAPSRRHTACTCQFGCPWRRCYIAVR